jgi:V-type H+-transporting ATPase subunit a
MVFLIGVDPVWTASDNELSFYNSLKMKLAVIIGVLQMLFGLFLNFS